MATRLPLRNVRIEGLQVDLIHPVNQECENLICTHPGENATCTARGKAAAPQTPTPQPTPTTTLRVIKNVVCLATDPNCAVPI